MQVVNTNPFRSLWQGVDRFLSDIAAESLILYWREKDPKRIKRTDAYLLKRGSYPKGLPITEQAFWDRYRKMEGPDLPYE